MKIAHFIFYGPRRSGMYETTRDLCAAECALGHDAKLIDTSWIGKGNPPETSRIDRGIEVTTLDWALECDYHVMHSRIHDEVFGKKPTVLILHGAPEYCFYSELLNHDKGDRNFSTLLAYKRDERVQKFVTMWPRHLSYWRAILGDENVHLVKAPVNLSEYSPEGKKHEFQTPGQFNVGFCDTWRPTFFKDPFQIIMGVREFWKLQPDIKMRLFAIPSTRDIVWDRCIGAIKKEGDFFGEIWELHREMATVYRALDVVVTTTVDASRITRECLSCGTPIIAPVGNPYTPYTVDIGNAEALAKRLCEIRDLLKREPERVKQECLETASQFSSEGTAEAFVEVLKSL